LNWLNEPPSWREENGELSVITGDRTDFWQRTFYGFQHDNGHFRYQTLTGDFTASVSFLADYQALYDQAGLMIRFAPDCWLKAGVEFVHGRCTLGSVITRGASDWAIGPIVDRTIPIRLRLSRKGADICLQWASTSEGSNFETLRLAYLSPNADAMVGPMTCSPTRAGLETRFTQFSVGDLVDFSEAV
jgi:uncharacterized protein